MRSGRIGRALALVAVGGPALALGVPGMARADPSPVTTAIVYATREGLVGRTTANGHVIGRNDHFVALPSWSALSARDTGDHSVRACAGGRCVYEPVWDVGPWNTQDDYWAGGRSHWTDLPSGTPEAQAAYQHGYNGGRDQYGRNVLNPAGIDLADGTVRDGLRLAGDNTWVTVSYLWTGGGTQGQVRTEGGTLNVRSGPGTAHPNVGLASAYARVPIQCQVSGEAISGAAGTTALWDRIGADNYVSHAYVVADAGVDPPRC
jgi:hypothetical protein